MLNDLKLAHQKVVDLELILKLLNSDTQLHLFNHLKVETAPILMHLN